MTDHYSRWNAALRGEKLDLGERGDPPCGFYRRFYAISKEDRGFEAVAVFRDGEDLGCIRNKFGTGAGMSAGEIDELFAAEVYAVPYDVYQAVAERGEPWPDVYTTRLTNDERRRGIVWTEEIGRQKLEGVVNERAVVGDNSKNAAPHELIAARINDLLDDKSKWLKEIGGEIQTKEQADKAANFKEAFAKVEKEAADAHEAEKRPILEAGREIDGRWKGLISKAKDEKSASARLVTPYLKRLEDEARAAARAKQAEAAAEAAPVRVEPVKARAGAGRGVSLRTVQRTVITDLPALAAFISGFKDPNPDFADVCRKLADKMLRAGVSVPGAELKEEQVAA